MNNVNITIDGNIFPAEQNGDCFIIETKPDFPADLSVVTISGTESEYELHNVEIIECASVDGRYWFAFREKTQEEIERQLIIDSLLEISEIIYE